MSEVIIDVRERDEYTIEHVEHSINVPLSVFATVAPGVLTQLTDRKIVFMCRGGLRAKQAKDIAYGMGFNDAHIYSIYEGGILQWIKEGNPVKRGASASALPLTRQTQLVIGVLVILFGSMGYFIDSIWSLVAGAMGIGLLLAGATGWCAMAQIVAVMPWNRSKKPCNPGDAMTPCGSNQQNNP